MVIKMDANILNKENEMINEFMEELGYIVDGKPVAECEQVENKEAAEELHVHSMEFLRQT